MQSDLLLQRLYYYKAFGYKFFDDDLVGYKSNNDLSYLKQTILRCNLCQNSKTRKNIIFDDKVQKNPKIMIISYSPTKTQDDTAKIVLDNSLENKFINEFGIEKSDIYTTYILKCYSNSNSLDSLTKCTPYVFEEINLLSPKIIICTGELVSKIVLKNDKLPAMQMIHGSIFKQNKSYIIPTFSLDFINSNPSKIKEFQSDLDKIYSVFIRL